MANKNIFIECGSLAEPRTSGIGNTTLNIIRTFARDEYINDHFTINVIVPFNKSKYLDRYGFDAPIVVRKLWLPGKISNLLTKLRLMPYMDIFFGKGIYVFPNYKNWPLLRSKSLTYVHDMAHERYPEFIEPKNYRYLKKHLSEWIQRTDKVITVSNHAKQEIEHFFPASVGKVVTVYNGYDSSLFYPEAYNEDVLKKYILERNKYFIFLSNVEPRKNVEPMLKAFSDYKINHPDHKLLIVGGMGWRNDKLVEMIDEINSEGESIVRPSHFVADEELPALLSGSIGLVHPALYEGFGISPLQALACGKHVIVGDNSSIPEVVGDAGTYVDVSDPTSIAKAMERLNELKMQVNEEGIKRARLYEWKNVLTPLKTAIRECSEDIY